MSREVTQLHQSKKRIIEALQSLLHDMTFQEVSVKEIVLQANVSRSTFYLHFPDKITLMNELKRSVYDEFIACYSSEEQKAIRVPYKLCLHIVEKRSIYQMIFNDANEMKHLADLLTAHFMPIFKDEDYAIFVSYGTIGYLQQWVQNNFMISPGEAAEKLMKIGYSIWTER